MVPGGLCKVGMLALALLGCGHHSGPQTPLDDMATCPLSGGLLLPRPCAPSLLSKPPWQQDTTAPVPGSGWEEARPAWWPGWGPRGTEHLGE